MDVRFKMYLQYEPQHIPLGAQVSSEGPHDLDRDSDPEPPLGIVGRLSRRGSTGSVSAPLTGVGALAATSQELQRTASSFEEHCARLAAAGPGAGLPSEYTLPCSPCISHPLVD